MVADAKRVFLWQRSWGRGDGEEARTGAPGGRGVGKANTTRMTTRSAGGGGKRSARDLKTSPGAWRGERIMTGPSVAIKLFGIERTRAWRSALNVVRKRRRNFIINFRGSSPATDVGRRRRYLGGALNFNRFLFLFIFQFFFVPLFSISFLCSNHPEHRSSTAIIRRKTDHDVLSGLCTTIIRKSW